MARYYRLLREKWAADAKSGEGARMYGGRWNPPGIAAVYLAASRALAALEVMVHAPQQALRLEWRIIEVEVPDDWIEKSTEMKLPGDWQDRPDSRGAQEFGGAWFKKGSHVALLLPSVIIPEEAVLLINPAHHRAGKLKWSAARRFAFDPRLT